jgi:hypothetical protein
MVKRFQVECSGCSFEQKIEGRVTAGKVARDHREETGHDVVAVELPPRRAVE